MKIKDNLNIFTRFANSKLGKGIYKKVLHPSKDEFLQNHLPVIESAAISMFYCGATAIQKDIPEENRKSLQIQNILSFIASMAISVPLNKKLSKFGDNVVKHLKPELMEDGHKVVDGLKVGLPLVSTLLVARYLVASALIPISTEVRDSINKNNKLDVQA